MRTFYFKIDFGYTDEDISMMLKEFYDSTEEGFFDPPEKEIILKIECDDLQNPFDKLAEVIKYGLYGARNYDKRGLHPVVITDITAEFIEEQAKREEEFRKALDEFFGGQTGGVE